VIELPGGRITRVRATERKRLGDWATVRIDVRDEAGRPTPARLSVRAGDGRHFAPDAARPQSDDGFDRTARRFEHAYWHARAEPQEVAVPAG
jgi:hypothetical protein